MREDQLDDLQLDGPITRVVQSRIMQYSRIDISNLEFQILY